mgnify:CR=1 FL=1
MISRTLSGGVFASASSDGSDIVVFCRCVWVAAIVAVLVVKHIDLCEVKDNAMLNTCKTKQACTCFQTVYVSKN